MLSAAVIKIKLDAVFLSGPGMTKKVPAEVEYGNLRRIFPLLWEGETSSQEFINKIKEVISVLEKTPEHMGKL